MKLGFNFGWFKHENSGISISAIEWTGDEYFEIIGLKIFKFMINLHLTK